MFKHKISEHTLWLIATYYLFLPLAIFLCSWVKLWIGIPITVFLGICPFFLFRDEGRAACIAGNRGKEWFFFISILAWVLLSGIGGYVWQNRWDHLFRNAVFIDLVSRSWPVQEGTDILTYYTGFWLPSALCAKLSGSIAVGWFVQLIYGFVGVWLAFRMFLNKIGEARIRFLFPFLFFSGIDIIYYLFSHNQIREDFHIELWSGIAAWESTTTLINWVYNQAIPSWVATMLILNCGKKRGVGPIVLCCLSLSAPFSVVGLLPLVVYYQILSIRHCRSIRETLKELFNFYNILSLLGLLPVVLYFMLSPARQFSCGIANMPILQWINGVGLLLCIEILVFIPFIFDQVKKNEEFYILLTTCVGCLFIQLGGGYGDFNWRIEIPFNYFMALQIAVFLNKWKKTTLVRRLAFILIAVLASVTPLFEEARILYMTYSQPIENYRSITFSTAFEFEDCRTNFVADSVLTNETKKPYLMIFRYEQ